MKTRSKVTFQMIALILLVTFGYAYWQIRHVDPEGACTEFQHLSLCIDAWLHYSYSFRPLPTDQEMIDQFKQNRSDFAEIAADAVSSRVRIRRGTWTQRYGIWRAEKYAVEQPPAGPSRSREAPPPRTRIQGYMFEVASTRYIRDAGPQRWPWVSREKGYLYFDSPPRVEGGYLVGKLTPTKVLEGEGIDAQRWPWDWMSYKCLLRRFEPQWFLFECRDRVGG